MNTLYPLVGVCDAMGHIVHGVIVPHPHRVVVHPQHVVVHQPPQVVVHQVPVAPQNGTVMTHNIKCDSCGTNTHVGKTPSGKIETILGKVAEAANVTCPCCGCSLANDAAEVMASI